MSYNLETTKQIYGNQLFLTHNIKGDTSTDDRHLFGMRVPSFGIINFGTMAAGQVKNFKPIDNGINSDISLKSAFAFTTSATNDEITLRLLDGTTEIAEQKLTNAQMPYSFPPGAIINPNLTIQVTTRYATTQMLLYWQPVHVLDYIEV